MKAMQIMSALSQPTRLRVWKHLVDMLPEGRPAGDIAEAMGMSKNSMSPHFAILAAADLVRSRKQGRTVVYSARTDAVRELADFLGAAVSREDTN